MALRRDHGTQSDHLNAWLLSPGVLPSGRRVLGLLAALILALSVALAACGRDKGDPEQIVKSFLVSLWTQDTAQIAALTCSDWRDVTSQWATETGDPAASVDTEHLQFVVVSENDRQITLEMSGVAALKSPGGQVEVRDYNAEGAVRFILVDEDGWKVCDLRPAS
ncbi:hypothetical protein [Aggregatilinea lenta]|uniref:hypothetical protein n=1 Tax=Aggregatilinea lenta TaxID=913108 RepID=UPI000E5A7557|nr:hypothetical protein [Aggregatilinea lenta]